MGLDVYLYHCPDRETARKKEEELEKKTEALWKMAGPYETLSEKQKDKINEKKKELAVALDCTGKYESYKDVTQVNEDSTLYPDHYFKIGYFRSSYNSGGVNSVLRMYGIGDLYYIFWGDEKENTPFEFKPDWKLSLKRVYESIEKCKKVIASPLSNISIYDIRFTPNTPPESKEEAMEVFKKEYEKWNKQVTKDSPFFGSAYSNRDGEWFMEEPIEVLAAIPGKSFIGPCVYLAVKQKEPVLDWYLKALEIVRETIEYVLSKPDPENYYFHWSS